MKHNFRIILTYALVIAGMSLGLTSCLKDKDKNCFANVTLRFSYTFNPENKERFWEELEDLPIYVFDENKQFLFKRTVHVDRVGEDRSVSLDVEPANYIVVVWGNVETCPSYNFIEGTSADETNLGIQVIPNKNGEVERATSDLFYGTTTVEAADKRKVEAEVKLIKNTNNINVLLHPESKQKAIPDSELSVRITSTNGRLNFYNSLTATEPTTYSPQYSQTTHENKPYELAAFKTMKLRIGDDTRIWIYEGNKVKKSESLTDLLIKNFPQIQTNEDFDRYSDFTFIFDLDYSLIEINAGPWTSRPGSAGGI